MNTIIEIEKSKELQQVKNIEVLKEHTRLNKKQEAIEVKEINLSQQFVDIALEEQKKKENNAKKLSYLLFGCCSTALSIGIYFFTNPFLCVPIGISGGFVIAKSYTTFLYF